ncbi:lipopolysaccharide biosynthesis protein [Duganella sp. LjRoot269]|jgi:O-antigen/teichoic acid export membrane protein|uniref:lipopolysaccharide biosynthesis protein n=1 Tax=Duganella sp. LjRoot269 TaxID=3342305 RepID=UPI003ECCEA3E
MALFKNLSLMALSTGMRLLAGVLSLAVTARSLGPEQFGLLMFWMAVCGLLSVVSNYGLSTFLLREIGRDRAAAPQLIGLTLSAKLILSAALLAGGLLALPFIGGQPALIFLLLLLALIGESFADYFCTGFRARDRFDLDARLAAMSALLYSAVVALAAWGTGSPLVVALAYLVSRGAVALIARHMLNQVLGPVRVAPWREGWALVRRTRSYALDMAMGTLFGQVDSVVLNYFGGPVAVGLHQGGMRFFLAGTQAGTVLSNVFIPRTAATQQGPAAVHQREKWRLQSAFLGIGIVGGLGFVLGGPLMVHTLFGPRFLPLIALTPWFGVLFVLRSAASSWGIVLTVEGGQRYRALASVAHWAVVGLLCLQLVPRYGNVGWLWSLIGGNVLLLLAYIGGVAKPGHGNGRMVAVTALVMLLFLPVLRLA